MNICQLVSSKIATGWADILEPALPAVVEKVLTDGAVPVSNQAGVENATT